MKISIIDLPKAYIDQGRWDVFSRALDIAVRNKNLKGVLASDLQFEISKSLKQDRIDILIKVE